MFVMGTAGHVDHGKSALVRALTGIDPDRLPIEQHRGMTTDLGFAWLKLPSGREVSVVDVPGHARYVKNMLAGSGAIDLALLVVAADEGPMPQTREHLAILELQEVRAALCVLTKIDRVEEEYADLAQAELESTLEKTPFAGAVCVRTSIRTGQGLAELGLAIDRTLDGLPLRQEAQTPHLAVDRVFTVKGFGTVLTGTLTGGPLAIGDEIELQPGALKGRIRGLQRHGSSVAHAGPGTRVAINVIGEAAERAQRGMVLARPGAVKASNIVDLLVRVPAIVDGRVRHNEGVTLLCGTAEAEGRLRLLDAEVILSGQSGWAQAVLESPLPLGPGDHCIIRTPNETVAGGIVVQLNPPRHRRNDASVLSLLALKAGGTTRERLVELLSAGPRTGISLPAALSAPEEAVAEALSSLLEERSVLEDGGVLYWVPWLDAAARDMTGATETFLRQNPLRDRAPREHVRRAARLETGSFEVAVTHATHRGDLAVLPGGALTLPGYEVALTPQQRAQADAFVASLVRGRFSPPSDHLPEPGLLSYLVEQRRIVSAGSAVVFERGVFDSMVAEVTQFLCTHATISLAETRDLFGTTRKYAQAFLEQLDALHITRRMGDARVLLRGGPGQANRGDAGLTS